MNIEAAPRRTRQQLVLKLVKDGRERMRVPTFIEALTIVNLALIAPASIAYLLSADERDKARQYQAWQVISLGVGQSASGGRIPALQDLAVSGVPLQKINLGGAYLREIAIPKADLKWALGDHADFAGANLRRTIFARGVFNQAHFFRANLNQADFSFAAAQNSRFNEASACGGLFIGAVLRGADFDGAKLQGARFDGADLRGAKFTSVSLPENARFRDANVAGLRAPRSFVEQALLQGAVSIADDAAWSRHTMAINPRLESEWPQADKGRAERRPEFRPCTTRALER